MSKTVSHKLPATAKRHSAGPRVTQPQVVAARLDPLLNKPYFQEAKQSMSCIHSQYGVKLDKTTQRAYCLQCKQEIALFDALWNYHTAEERLVETLQSLDEHDKREVARKERDRARRPFVRDVTASSAVRDMSLKSEPVVGRIYTLECGHKRKMDGGRVLSKVHCTTCQMEANTVHGGKKP